MVKYIVLTLFLLFFIPVDNKTFKFIKMNHCDTMNVFLFKKNCNVDEVSLTVVADIKSPIAKLWVYFELSRRIIIFYYS